MMIKKTSTFFVKNMIMYVDYPNISSILVNQISCVSILNFQLYHIYFLKKNNVLSFVLIIQTVKIILSE